MVLEVLVILEVLEVLVILEPLELLAFLGRLKSPTLHFEVSGIFARTVL